MSNNSDQVIEALRSKIVNTQEGSGEDITDELSRQVELLRRKEELLADELDYREREKESFKECLQKVEGLRVGIEKQVCNCETLSTATGETTKSPDLEDEGNHQVTVIDTKIMTDIHDQLASLREFEDDLKANFHKFELDHDVLDRDFGMNIGDRRSLRKLRQKIALFLDKSYSSINHLESKVVDYMGSIGEERYTRIKDLESQLEDKEKMVKLMEKQNAYHEQTLNRLRAQLDDKKTIRRGFFRKQRD